MDRELTESALTVESVCYSLDQRADSFFSGLTCSPLLTVTRLLYNPVCSHILSLTALEFSFYYILFTLDTFHFK